VADRCPTCVSLEAENAALTEALNRAGALLRRTEVALTDGIDLLDDVRAVEHKLELADEAEDRRG
jgi:hypothetical protein